MLHYNVATGKLLGFSIRDFGALKVWQDDMFASIGERVELLKGNAAERPSRADVRPALLPFSLTRNVSVLTHALSYSCTTSSTTSLYNSTYIVLFVRYLYNTPLRRPTILLLVGGLYGKSFFGTFLLTRSYTRCGLARMRKASNINVS